MTQRPPLHDICFSVEPLVERHNGWWVEVIGQTRHSYGPFATRSAAAMARYHLFRRWDAAARARGGWAWKASSVTWVVTVPKTVEVPGWPLQHTPCTRHEPGPPDDDSA